MRKDIQEAKRRLQKVRELAAKIPSPFKGMTLEEAIRKMRKIREELWEEKLAIRS
jgi:hypothetical protein